MASAAWSTLDGVGRSKKNDSHRFAPRAISSGLAWHGFRRRRLALAVIVVIALYFFVKNIPTDVVPVGQRYSSSYGSLAPAQANHGLHKDDLNNKEHPPGQWYEGPIRFEHLAASLRPHILWTESNNVLFILPELSSVSVLLPIACQMAERNRSSVHVAILGAHDLEATQLLKVNGISAKDCPVNWHDARPDHALKSTRGRIEMSIRTGSSHCIAALRPKVVVVDGSDTKHSAMARMLHEVAAQVNVPLVALPANVIQSLPWVTALDSSSLRMLSEIQIDIVIQAYTESAGTLIRLLRSIESANYEGLPIPRLTIELPTRIDPFVLRFLQDFRWPPGASLAESQLTLRHRLDTGKSSHAEAAFRTIELYYPPTSSRSHILLVNPSVELSPIYLHYLAFTLLEYRYGQDHHGFQDSLFGISLNLPEKNVNGEAISLEQKSSRENPFIMMQAPSKDAALIIGDKWVELQHFLSQRLAHDPDLNHKSTAADSTSTPIHGENPSWLTEMLDLMQARNHQMLYPSHATQNDLKLVMLHKELSQNPEEYAQVEQPNGKPGTMNVEQIMKSDVLTGDMKLPVSKKDNVNSPSRSLPLRKLLSFTGKKSQQHLPPMEDIPLFTNTGRSTDWSNSRRASAEFADTFSLHQGGCDSLGSREQAKRGIVEYLFCNTG